MTDLNLEVGKKYLIGKSSVPYIFRFIGNAFSKMYVFGDTEGAHVLDIKHGILEHIGIEEYKEPVVKNLANEKMWFGSNDLIAEDKPFFPESFMKKGCGQLCAAKKTAENLGWAKIYRLEIEKGRIVEEEE